MKSQNLIVKYDVKLTKKNSFEKILLFCYFRLLDFVISEKFRENCWSLRKDRVLHLAGLTILFKTEILNRSSSLENYERSLIKVQTVENQCFFKL